MHEAKLLNKMSVTQLAELSNLSKSYISQVKNGKRPPSAALLAALSPKTKHSNANIDYVNQFLKSRRQGLSPRTMEYYEYCLKPLAQNYQLTPKGINQFLANLSCANAKHAYFRAIRALCNWLYRQGYIKDNPILKVDAPKPTKEILPSLTIEQVEYIIDYADGLQNKVIIALLADSGMRLNELVNLQIDNIDWDTCTVTIWGKGNKQRKAAFTNRTASLLRQWLSENTNSSNLWTLRARGIQIMLHRLSKKTGLPCNPHTLRRTFASNLHRKGLDVEHIMRLGGWESLDMVLRYTKSVKFEDSLKLYQQVA